jgi:hypothetical protein
MRGSRDDAFLRRLCRTEEDEPVAQSMSMVAFWNKSESLAMPLDAKDFSVTRQTTVAGHTC